MQCISRTLPVRMAWSIFNVVERISVTLMSAGTLSPTGWGWRGGVGRGVEAGEGGEGVYLHCEHTHTHAYITHLRLPPHLQALSSLP